MVQDFQPLKVLIACSSCTSEEDTDVTGENWGVSMVLLRHRLTQCN